LSQVIGKQKSPYSLLKPTQQSRASPRGNVFEALEESKSEKSNKNARCEIIRERNNVVEYFSPLYLASIVAKGENYNEPLVRKFGILQRNYDFRLFKSES
jgi:hypothetical protein